MSTIAAKSAALKAAKLAQLTETSYAALPAPLSFILSSPACLLVPNKLNVNLDGHANKSWHKMPLNANLHLFLLHLLPPPLLLLPRMKTMKTMKK